MYCAQCGTSNQPGGETCELCGAPLSPRSGPDECPSCHAPVSTYDRFCQGCGAPLGTVDASQHFEPGPSFVDDQALLVNPSELPPWLRDLAAASPPPAPQAPAAEPDEKLPDWLRATRSSAHEPLPADPEPPLEEVTPVEALPLGDEFSLIGDEDLPEWLRALGDEEPAMSAAPGPDASGPRSAAPAAVLDVPSVSRAWLTTPRAIDPNLDAAARPDFFPAEAAVAAAPAMQAAEAIAPADEPAPVLATAVTAVPDPAARVRRLRILLLIVGIVVILFALYYLTGLRH